MCSLTLTDEKKLSLPLKNGSNNILSTAYSTSTPNESADFFAKSFTTTDRQMGKNGTSGENASDVVSVILLAISYSSSRILHYIFPWFG